MCDRMTRGLRPREHISAKQWYAISAYVRDEPVIGTAAVPCHLVCVNAHFRADSLTPEVCESLTLVGESQSALYT